MTSKKQVDEVTEKIDPAPRGPAKRAQVENEQEEEEEAEIHAMDCDVRERGRGARGGDRRRRRLCALSHHWSVYENGSCRVRSGRDGADVAFCLAGESRFQSRVRRVLCRVVELRV